MRPEYNHFEGTHMGGFDSRDKIASLALLRNTKLGEL
jgi:hypothetical protein